LPPKESINNRLRPKGDFMRNLVLALLSVSGLAVIGAAPAEAVGTAIRFAFRARTIRV
jgi:hypothetical protein